MDPQIWIYPLSLNVKISPKNVEEVIHYFVPKGWYVNAYITKCNWGRTKFGECTRKLRIIIRHRNIYAIEKSVYTSILVYTLFYIIIPFYKNTMLEIFLLKHI